MHRGFGIPFVTHSFDDVSLFVPRQDIIHEKPYPMTLTLEASSWQNGDKYPIKHIDHISIDVFILF